MEKFVEAAVIGPCCSGCLACVETAPDVFAFDEDNNVAVVLKNPCDAESVRKAVAYCPDDCIEIVG